MVQVELSKEELNSIVVMIESASVSMSQAEKGLALLNKFKEALKCQEKED